MLKKKKEKKTLNELEKANKKLEEINKHINYFSEAKMNAQDRVGFYNSLPDNMKHMIDKPENFMNYGKDTVLQGYRGPAFLVSKVLGDSKVIEPENNLFVVKYWYGVTKMLAFNPLSFVAARTVQDTRWKAIYFDKKGCFVKFRQLEEVE